MSSRGACQLRQSSRTTARHFLCFLQPHGLRVRECRDWTDLPALQTCSTKSLWHKIWQRRVQQTLIKLEWERTWLSKRLPRQLSSFKIMVCVLLRLVIFFFLKHAVLTFAETGLYSRQTRVTAKLSVSVLHDRRNPVTHEKPGASTLAVGSVAQTSFSEIKSS